MIEEGTFILIDDDSERPLMDIVKRAQEKLKGYSFLGFNIKLKAIIRLHKYIYRVVYEFETSN